MSKDPTLLPLGSAVKIEDDENTYVIIARGFQKQADDGFLAGYKGVLHPQGSATGLREVVIRQTQIAEVVHRGYEDKADTVFAKQQLENAKSPPKKQSVPDAEPDLTIDVTRPAVVAPAAGSSAASTSASPPASPQTSSAAAVSVTNAKDPFSELRTKGKRK